MTISFTTSEEILEHYGVKGMKWGVRKDASRADKKWAKNIYSVRGAVAVHNRAVDIANARLPAINNKAQYQPAFKTMEKYDEIQRNGSNKDEAKFEQTREFKDASRSLNKYYKEVEADFNRATTQAVKDVHGISPSGRYEAKLQFDAFNAPSKIIVQDRTLAHSEIPQTNYEFELNTQNGVILSAKFVKDDPEDEMEQTDLYFEHYGTKGMKWGVRKQLARRNAKDRDKKTGTENALTRGKGKKLGLKKTQPGKRTYDPKKLNNQELKKVVARMRLEQEYVQLNNKSIKKGNNAATRILKNAGEKNIQRMAEVGLGAAIGLALSQAPKLAKSPAAKKLVSEIAKRF